MKQITDALTRKLGPLPAWAWGVVAAGGIWVLRGFRSSSRSDTVPTTIGESSVIPSLSGGGAAPEASPNYGAPGGDASPTYFSSPDFTYEGDPGLLESIIANFRSDVTTGGGGDAVAPPEPTGTSTATYTAPTTTTTVRWRLYWLSNPNATVGWYDSRYEGAQAAIQLDPDSDPPGSSMGIERVEG